jgi:hypothetical protein
MTEDKRDTSLEDDNIYGMMMKSDKELQQDLNQDIETDDQEQNINSGRPLVSRVFGKMEAGSLRGSIFAMSSMALGTGCLTLPQVFDRMSMLLAIIIIISGGIAAYWCLTILIIAGRRANVYDYSRLVKECFGTGLGKALDIVIMLFIFGIMIAYQVISI